MTTQPYNNPKLGILLILVGVTAISLNDMMIKFLSGDYPLHQMVFVRSAIGIFFTLVIVRLEGGLSILRTHRPWLHVARGLLIVVSNLTYFVALASVSLAEATALFFVAPLLITLLSVPVLGERVGLWRMSAVVTGFVGVLIMLQPWQEEERSIALWIQILPLIAALTYALNQVLTRLLGTTTKASAMAFYIQAMFVVVSLGFYWVAGDGRYVVGVENPSVLFLLRAWSWPTGSDIWLFLLLGLNASVVGYTLSQAYRMADAGTIAPFEYVGLPLAVFWGWLIWSDLPNQTVTLGIGLILSGGAIVVLRERLLQKTLVSAKRVHRRY